MNSENSHEDSFKLITSAEGKTQELAIENCLWQYFKNPIYSRTMEQMAMTSFDMRTFGTDEPSVAKERALDRLRRFGLAFNRHLIIDGCTFKKMEGGSDGWAGHFRRWLMPMAKKVQDPDTLHTNNQAHNQTLPYGNDTNRAATTGWQASTNSTKKIGGIPADKAADFFNLEVKLPG